MSIKEIYSKIKGGAKKIIADEHLFSALLVIAVGVASFGLGRLSVEEERPGGTEGVRYIGAVSGEDVREERGGTSAEETEAHTYVASKNSDKYHLPWCSGAQRIAEENKIWFSTKEEAEAAGYAPAANCKGM